MTNTLEYASETHWACKPLEQAGSVQRGTVVPCGVLIFYLRGYVESISASEELVLPVDAHASTLPCVFVFRIFSMELFLTRKPPTPTGQEGRSAYRVRF